jgi:hypothetical protein
MTILRKYRFRRRPDWQDTTRWSPQKKRLHQIFRGAFVAPSEPEEVDGEEIATERLEEAEEPEVNTAIDRDDEGDELPEGLEQAIAVLQTLDPELSRQMCVHRLVNTAHGRSLMQHLSKGKDTPVMDRATELRKIAKEYGVHKLAGLLVTENKSHGISESELTSLIFEESRKHALPGERSNSAFARYFSLPENVTLRKAIAVARNTLVPVSNAEPVQKTIEVTPTPAEQTAAYAKLQDKAAILRAQSPELSEAQAFSKAFAANPDLAVKAHVRPSVGSGYSFPK